MQLDCEANRKSIIQAFPRLEFDKLFKITSNNDPAYNCIAWAANYSNIWWEPSPGAPFDGTYWPLESLDKDIKSLIDAFKFLKYEICDNCYPERKFKKVALYQDEDGNYTHASRQLRSGVWTSKLGQSFDISHGSPFTVEGDAYGKAKIFMSKKY